MAKNTKAARPRDNKNGAETGGAKNKARNSRVEPPEDDELEDEPERASKRDQAAARVRRTSGKGEMPSTKDAPPLFVPVLICLAALIVVGLATFIATYPLHHSKWTPPEQPAATAEGAQAAAQPVEVVPPTIEELLGAGRVATLKIVENAGYILMGLALLALAVFICLRFNWELFKGSWRKLLLALTPVWCITVIMPLVLGVIFGAKVFDQTIDRTEQIDLSSVPPGKYRMVVQGRFLPPDDNKRYTMEGDWKLVLGDRSGGQQSFEGSFTESLQRRKFYRRVRGYYHQASTTAVLKLRLAPGVEYFVRNDQMGEKLAGGLRVQLYRTPYPLWPFFILGPLLALVAIWLDALLKARRSRAIVNWCVSSTVGLGLYHAVSSLPNVAMEGYVLDLLVGAFFGLFFGVLASYALEPLANKLNKRYKLSLREI